MSGYFSRFADRGLPAQLALYGIGLCLLCGSLAGAMRETVSAVSTVAPNALAAFSSPVPNALVSAPTVESRVLSDEAWASQLRQQNYWSDRRYNSSAAGRDFAGTGKPSIITSKSSLGMPPGIFFFPPVQQALPPSSIGDVGGYGSGNTYATMCVRLCDGYYYPVSHSTTRDRFSEDDRKCRSSCGADARLFVYRNEGGSPEDMEDLKGDPYTKLKTAFLYRTSYDAACKCRPHPWEQQALDQHRVYALEARVRKGDKQAVAELKTLKADIAAGRTSQPRAAAIPGQRADAISPTRVAAAPAPTLTDGTRQPAGVLGVAAAAGASVAAVAAPSHPITLSPLRPVAPGTSSLPPRIEPAVGARLAADGPPARTALPAAAQSLRVPPGEESAAAPVHALPSIERPSAKAAKPFDVTRATPAPGPGVQPVVLINPGPTKTANVSRGEGWKRKVWSDR